MREAELTNHRECAMKDGTLLGCLWILTFTFSTIMMRHLIMNQALGLVCMFLTIGFMAASPVLAFSSAKSHWMKEPEANVSFLGIWKYIAIMYFCAILLSSVAQFIYYEYCDPYLFYDFVADFSMVRLHGDEDSMISNAIIEQLKAIDSMSTGEIVLQQTGGHLSRDILMATLLAFLLSKNLKQKTEL